MKKIYLNRALAAKKILFTLLAALMLVACTKQNDKMANDQMNDWSGVFQLSENVSHKKVSIQNQYGLTLVGDLYTPKSVSPQDGLSVKRSVSKAVFRQSRCPVLSGQPKSRVRGCMP